VRCGRHQRLASGGGGNVHHDQRREKKRGGKATPFSVEATMGVKEARLFLHGVGWKDLYSRREEIEERGSGSFIGEVGRLYTREGSPWFLRRCLTKKKEGWPRPILFEEGYTPKKDKLIRLRFPRGRPGVEKTSPSQKTIGGKKETSSLNKRGGGGVVLFKGDRKRSTLSKLAYRWRTRCERESSKPTKKEKFFNTGGETAQLQPFENLNRHLAKNKAQAVRGRRQTMATGLLQEKRIAKKLDPGPGGKRFKCERETPIREMAGVLKGKKRQKNRREKVLLLSCRGKGYEQMVSLSCHGR